MRAVSIDTADSTDPELVHPVIHAERDADVAGCGSRTGQVDSDRPTGNPSAVPRDPADQGRRTHRQGAWLLGPKVRTVLLVVLAVLVVVLLVRPHATANPEDFSVLATEVNAAMTAQPEVTQSTGGYLPGTGIVLVSSVKGVQNSQLDAILAKAITASADPIATLPDGEAVSWQVTSTGSGGFDHATGQGRRSRRARSDPVAAGSGGGERRIDRCSGQRCGDGPGVAWCDAKCCSAVWVCARVGVSGRDGGSARQPATATAGATGGATGTAAPAAAGTGALTDDFSTDSKNWSPLTGTWKVVERHLSAVGQFGVRFHQPIQDDPARGLHGVRQDARARRFAQRRNHDRPTKAGLAQRRHHR